MTPENALHEIIQEYGRAAATHGSFPTQHHGYAAILEELDELWDEIKKRAELRSRDDLVKEARQVGAMALRFMVDLL
jgi:hypothetical protein